MKRSVLLFLCGIIVLANVLNSCRKEDPPTVTTIFVRQITATSALSGGCIATDGGASVTARGVCWSTSPNPMIIDAHTSDSVGTGSYASTITGLTPATTYYVRAYATNTAGTAYGQEIVFDNSGEQSGTFTDTRDNKTYKWVRIGDQVWMAENLAYLPSVSHPADGSFTDPYYSVYGYQGSSVSEAKATVNYQTYGVLYNWPAAIVSCPDGWHLPSDAEWTQLTDYIGGESVAGGKLKETGTTHWASPNEGATNETGFTALPGGEHNYYNNFSLIGTNGDWWSSTDWNFDSAPSRGMYSRGSNVYVGRLYYYVGKWLGFSVRCLRDN